MKKKKKQGRFRQRETDQKWAEPVSANTHTHNVENDKNETLDVFPSTLKLKIVN